MIGVGDGLMHDKAMNHCLNQQKSTFIKQSSVTRQQGVEYGCSSVNQLMKYNLIEYFKTLYRWYLIKARYGGSNMKKINNGGRLLIFYMMEGIKKVNWKNGILWLFSVTDPPKIQDGRQI